MPAETATPPAAPATPAPAPASAPTTPALPPAQAASYKATPAPAKPASQTPSPAAQQASDNASIEARMKAVAKEAFANAKEETGRDFVAEPVSTPDATEPAKPESKKDKKSVFDSVAAKDDAPSKPAPEATSEAKDRFSDIAPPDGATETTQKGWKALKEKANAEIAAAEKKLADALSQVETFRKATPAEQADAAKLKADLQAAHDRLAVLDVSAHPDFHRQFVEPQKKALAEAGQLLADNAVANAPDMKSLLNLPRTEFAKKVSELAAGMPAFDQGTFVTNMREAYRLQDGQAQALTKAGELQQQLVAQSAQRQKQAFDETYKNFNIHLKPLEVADNATKEERAEAEAFNAAMSEIRPKAERYAFGKIDEKGVADLASRAAANDFIVQHAVPRMQREHAAALKLIAEQTAELSAIKKAKSPGTFSGDQSKAAPDPSKMTFSDSMRMAKEAAARGETIR